MFEGQDARRGPPKRVRPRGEARLVLVSLLREGPLAPKEIDKDLAFASNIEGLGDVLARNLRLGRRQEESRKRKYDAAAACERLVGLGMIKLNEGAEFELRARRPPESATSKWRAF